MIADAPAHGFCNSGDSHVTRNGINQKKRTLDIVENLANIHGAELLFCSVGGEGYCDDMVDAFNSTLSRFGTFFEKFEVDGSAQTMFTEKIKASVEGVVATAIANSKIKGLEIFSGSDTGVLVDIACSRFKDDILKISSTTVAESAIEKCISTLQSSDYDLVRNQLSNVNEGLFQSYSFREAGLARASVMGKIILTKTLK